MGELNDNRDLWDRRRTHNPSYYKIVEYGRRKFTAVDAYSVLEAATEEWGPMGKEWGLRETDYRIVSGQDGSPHVILVAEFYYPGGHFPLAVDETLGKGNDALKKVTTACIKKALSYLGFAADVHKGQYEDEQTIKSAQQTWDKQHSHENTVEMLDKILKTGIGCKSPDELDLVCQWATEPGMVYERVVEEAGAPSRVIDGIKKRTKEGVAYADILALAQQELEIEL